MSVLLSIRVDLTGPEITITPQTFGSLMCLPKARDMHRVLYSNPVKG